ncbi:MAG: T9SS type A sorting domain-containing protein [Saprospiraceae bacterium]|nr:T9SS type A sorting domain-containing protein [Saprospiraceae bacterium]
MTEGEDLLLLPNPATTSLEIQGVDLEYATIRIVDAAGKQILQQTAQGNKLDISALPAGLYYLTITNNQTTSTRQFVRW